MKFDAGQRLLLDLVNRGLHGSAAPVASVQADAVNWDRWLAMARRQGVSPLLHAALIRDPAWPVPADIREELARDWAANVIRAMLQEKALLEIAAAFRERNIRYVVHKGLALAALVYAEPRYRPSGSDIDIFVKADDFSMAREILAGLGYAAPDTRREAHDLDFIGEASLTKKLGSLTVIVDLHRDFIGNIWGKVTRFDIPGAWERTVPVHLGRDSVPHLPIEAALFFLIVHCAVNHVFSRMILFCDVDQLFRKFGRDIDGNIVRNMARRLKAVKALDWTLAYCEILLGTPLPDAMRAGRRPRGLAWALVPEGMLFLRAEAPPKRLERYMHLLLLDDIRLAWRSLGIFIRRLWNESRLKRRGI